MEFGLNFTWKSIQKSQTARPMPVISTFTESLNRKMQRFSHIEKNLGDKIKDLQFSSLPKMPHFSDLIEKIDEITERRKTIIVDYQLTEGDPYYFKLNKKEKIRFQIETLNRVCPLTLNISKNIKPLTYVSSKHQLPDKDNCEKTFKNDCFFLSDKSFRFKTRVFYFCVVANEAAEVCISYGFRKKEDIPKIEKILNAKDLVKAEIEKIRSDEVLKQDFCQHVEKLLEGRRKTSSQNSQNFLMKNKTFQTACEKKEMIRSKSEERVKRAKSVNLRRDSLYLNKKSKMIEFFAKQEIRTRERKEKDRKEKENIRKNAEIKTWLKLIVFSYSCQVIKFKFWELKNLKLISLVSAKRIQKNYRRWSTKFFDNIAKEFVHCRNALLLFYKTAVPFVEKFKSGFLRSINTQVSCMKPVFVFDIYVKKIIVIQRFIKNYLNLRECLLGKGIKMWMLQITKIVKKYLKLKKKNNRFLNSVLGIKESQVKEHLRRYFKEKCGSRRLTWYNFHTFLPSKSELFKLIKNASLES